MSTAPTGAKGSYIFRLRAGILVLAASVLLCWVGGHFVARQFGLGLGWAILIALAIWTGVGILIARLDTRIYYGVALAVTLFLAYLVYDFTRSALDWSNAVALTLAVLASVLLAFTFHDFRRLKHELRLWAYRR